MPGNREAPADPSAAAGAMDGERMLAEALAAEASKAAKHSKDPFADLGVKFVEARLPLQQPGAGCLCVSIPARGSLLLFKLEYQHAAPHSQANPVPPVL